MVHYYNCLFFIFIYLNIHKVCMLHINRMPRYTVLFYLFFQFYVVPITIFFIWPCTQFRKFITCNWLNSYYYLGFIYSRSVATVSKEFDALWNYPQCIGSIDGKHIVLQSPINSGSEFYNYKGFFNIILFALVDTKYNFLFVDTGSRKNFQRRSV